MKDGGVDAIPYSHDDLDIWRDNFQGVSFHHKKTNLNVCGAIDDVWEDAEGNLIVVDYKATSKDGVIETLADSAWEEQYKRQMGVYQWLLRQNGYNVSDTGYFVYANGSSAPDLFNNTLTFETTLVPCIGDTSWIEPTLDEIKECLESDVIPKVGAQCEFCPYREACGKKLQEMHKNGKK